MIFDPRYCRNESEVGSKFIVQYLLPNLGYLADNWYQEIAFGKIRLDFLVLARNSSFTKPVNRSSCLIIEAKHPKENLKNHSHRLQHYLNCLKIPWGLLTNGRDVRLFYIHRGTIKLVFNCSGWEIESKLEELKFLVSREQLLAENRPQQQILSTPNSRNSMKTIAIYHHKGGVGKTTVATNLAAAFSKKGKRVLLIDIDAQANSTFAVGLVKFQFDEEDDLRDKNIYHLLKNSNMTFIVDVVRKSQGFNQPEIDVIPSHISLIQRQSELNNRSASACTRLAKKLDKVSDDYDIVIIDTPPSLDLYAQTALTAADYLLIPSDLKPFSNQGLNSVKNFILEAINENRENLGKQPLKILGVLPSKISTHAQYLKHTFPKQKQVIPDKYHLPLMDTVISERMALSHCINQTITMGDLEFPAPQSIMDYAENKAEGGVSASEFESLAIEILDKMAVM